MRKHNNTKNAQNTKKRVIKRKTLKEFPNYYATRDGHIVNKKTKHTLLGHVDKDGYIYVQFIKNKKVYTRKVHRLIYMAFHKKVDSSIDIHHRDGDKKNNSLENLEAIPKSKHVSMHNKGKIVSAETRKKISEARRKLFSERRKFKQLHFAKNNKTQKSKKGVKKNGNRK